MNLHIKWQPTAYCLLQWTKICWTTSTQILSYTV